uniref:Ycf36 n=1 Tax=Panagrolaimus sp. ES5 TaxID=591445 RepID=A0AC34F375_9BILA
MFKPASKKPIISEKVPAPIIAAGDPSLPLPSQEVLRDLSKETALIHASDEKSNDQNINEYYNYFWCLRFSVGKVATNFSIFLLFFDAFNICIAFRIKYLSYQLLYFLSIFGPLALIFGVNVETYFNFAFVTTYFATTMRLLINGLHIWIYYEKMLESKETEEEYQRFVEIVTKENFTETIPSEIPSRDPNLFRTIYPFVVLMGICVIMIALQIWTLSVAIPRSHSWIKKKTTHSKK